MNALSLHHDLKKRGVILTADGDKLKVSAPAGVLTEEDRDSISESKPTLLKLLSRQASQEPEDDGRRFKSRRSKYPGYTSLYDPIQDEWHDFPTQDCLPSIVAEANLKKGATA